MTFQNVKPIWDEVAAEYKVDTATVKGLADIHAPTRDEFNSQLLEAFPVGTRIRVEYSDYFATLECAPVS